MKRFIGVCSVAYNKISLPTLFSETTDANRATQMMGRQPAFPFTLDNVVHVFINYPEGLHTNQKICMDLRLSVLKLKSVRLQGKINCLAPNSLVLLFDAE